MQLKMDDPQNLSQQGERESDYFWAAVMFYTRIPTPKSANHSQQILNRSRKYFTLIGIIVGCIAATSYCIASMVFGTLLSIALSMAVTLLITGAFHEDGFADSCDGLGGGWNTEQVLTIMKDSRVGTYATVGLYFLLTIKLLSLWEIASTTDTMYFALIYICAHTLSRQLSSMMIETYEYVQDIDISKVKLLTEQRLSKQDSNLSRMFCGAPLLILFVLDPVLALLATIASFIISKLFINYCERRIGGYTGDILGAIQQLSELAFYLAVAARLA